MKNAGEWVHLPITVSGPGLEVREGQVDDRTYMISELSWGGVHADLWGPEAVRIISLSLASTVHVLNKHRHQGCDKWQVDDTPWDDRCPCVVGEDRHENLLSPLEAKAVAFAYLTGLTEESVLETARAELRGT